MLQHPPQQSFQSYTDGREVKIIFSFLHHTTHETSFAHNIECFVLHSLPDVPWRSNHFSTTDKV